MAWLWNSEEFSNVMVESGLHQTQKVSEEILPHALVPEMLSTQGLLHVCFKGAL